MVSLIISYYYFFLPCQFLFTPSKVKVEFFQHIDEQSSSSLELAEFTSKEVRLLQKRNNFFINKKIVVKSKIVDRFLNCRSSLDVDHNINSSKYNNF